MKKVLIISKNRTPSEVKFALQSAFNDDIKLIRIDMQFETGDELNKLKQEYDEFIITAPSKIIKQIINNGIKPLKLIFDFKNKKGKKPKFIGIKRINNIDESIIIGNE